METGLIIGVALEMAVGILCIVLGLLIWKKRKVSLLHEYHYQRVKPDDIPAYCSLTGIGLIMIGTGICFAGIINLLFRTLLSLVALGLGFLLGIAVMRKAQKKYNGSWF